MEIKITEPDTRVFKPKEDITIFELARIFSLLELAIDFNVHKIEKDLARQRQRAMRLGLTWQWTKWKACRWN